MRGNPWLLKGNPWFFKGNPWIFKGNLLILRGNPSLLKGNPWFFKGNPSILKGNPLIFERNPLLLKGNPWFLKGNPWFLKGNPPIFKGNPLIFKGNPLLLKGNPLFFEGILDFSKGNFLFLMKIIYFWKEILHNQIDPIVPSYGGGGQPKKKKKCFFFFFRAAPPPQESPQEPPTGSPGNLSPKEPCPQAFLRTSLQMNPPHKSPETRFWFNPACALFLQHMLQSLKLTGIITDKAKYVWGVSQYDIVMGVAAWANIYKNRQTIQKITKVNQIPQIYQNITFSKTSQKWGLHNVPFWLYCIVMYSVASFRIPGIMAPKSKYTSISREKAVPGGWNSFLDIFGRSGCEAHDLILAGSGRGSKLQDVQICQLLHLFYYCLHLSSFWPPDHLQPSPQLTSTNIIYCIRSKDPTRATGMFVTRRSPPCPRRLLGDS